MPKKKKRGAPRKKKDDSPGDVSECESLERLPSSKKVAAASSTSHLEDEVDHLSSFTRVSLNSSKSESGEAASLSSAHFFCNYCEFSTESKSVLIGHMRQHMIRCPHCSFSSLSRIEVSSHCKHEHQEDPEVVPQEVHSSSADCEMDKDPCTACVFCSFLTYSTEHLEKHTLHKHPGMLAKSVARMITKQSSTEVRRDDAFFYLSISNDGLVKSSGFSLMTPEKSSSPIVIDPVVRKPEDIKPEIKCSYAKSVSSIEQTEQSKCSVNHSDAMAGEKLANRNMPTKVESSGVPVLVKVETLYCLTCPYSNVYIEKLKCHTVVQHPVGAAVATYNSTGADADDITFFCVREECNHSSSDCASYQKHLMNCCSCQKTMKVLEKERLKSTITYILEHQKKYRLPPVDGFFNFASLFLDICLPPAFMGISSTASVETMSSHQRMADNSLNVAQPSALHTAKASADSSLVATGLYRTSNHLSSTSVSSSGSPSTESNSSKSSQMFFPQQTQGMNQNIHSVANTAGDYQNLVSHNSMMLPAQTDCFPRNLPSDGRSLQPVQSHSVGFYPQSHGNYPQSSSANSHGASYPDNQQATTAWHTGQVQATGLASVTVQPSPMTSNVMMSSSVMMSSDVMTVANPMTCNVSNVMMSSDVTTFSNPMTGTVSNTMIVPDVMTLPNPVTSHMFYGQNTVSNVHTTPNIDQGPVDAQPLPKMVDLLSDSYSILLSDEFGPDGQIQQVADSNSFNQTQHIPVCPPSYQPEPMSNVQSQAVVSQSPISAMPLGQPVLYQPMQHEGSRFQQVTVDGSQLPGNQFSYPVANQNNQMTAVGSNLGQNSGFQTVQNPNGCGVSQSALSSQNSSNYGALKNALSPEESSNAPPAPYQSSEVPNFLVSPGTQSSEMAPVQPQPANSFSSHHPSTGQPAIGHPGTFTPPKNSHPGNKFAGASPLSPSIYLSGQAPRHKRSNWTDADMSPRGMMSGMSPRHVHPPVPAPGSQSFMNQRQFVPGRRGYSRGPRMPSGRGRMPTPRMAHNQLGGGDDDEVIVTAVIRGTPPKSQQIHQQPAGRGAYRGTQNLVPRGRGQVLPVQNRQRNPTSVPRRPYPVAVPPPQPPKHFDISKHFEDLACVVNASADDPDGGGDDIQILGVTPGKDNDKANQPKAVDASKFSFCCVHCGKDQGSKTVMKQHMKARHNDSLLGAFTNTETGQLLFFCPQINCEFMTYDEKRLSEHLSKCFDVDRSKPFDFGTAIKNLKSLKIRQLDVRTMGRSHEFPIDLDGQGMKDNFSSSLNDAFGDIVVNASGRHMLRNASPQQTRLSQPQYPSTPPQSKSPVRHTPPSNMAARQGNPRFVQPGNIVNRMHRPMVSAGYPKQQSYEMRPRFRHAGPIDARNIRDMRPRAPGFAVHRQPMQLRAAPPLNVTTPRMPSRSQEEPVIIIDVDSPERPDEGQQHESMIIDSPENVNQLGLVSTSQSTSSVLIETPPQIRAGYSEMTSASSYPEVGNASSYPEVGNASSYREQHQNVPDNSDLGPDHAESASPNLFPAKRSSHDDSRPDGITHSSQLSSVIAQPVSYSYDGNNSVDDEPELDEHHLQQNNVAFSGTLSRNSNSAALSSRQDDEPNSEYSPDRPTVNLNVSVTHRSMETYTGSMEHAPTASYVETSGGHSQNTEHATDNSHGIPAYLPTSSSSSFPPSSNYLTTEPIEECLDEEEKVNALVLEKVFAKVPNMPKNLSRRLVAKFKEYAKHRGVKITTDSKVIDEFVSKIYYKGSGGDRTASKPPLPSDTAQFQPAGPPHVPTSSPLAPAVSNSSFPSSENVGPPHKDGDEESPQEYRNCNTDTVQEDLQPKEHFQEEQMAAAETDLAEQSSADDVVATQVILAEKTLHFSPTFANLAMKSSAASTKLLENNHTLDVGQKNLETNPAESSDSVLKPHRYTNRRNSLSERLLPASVSNLRRSGSLPHIVSSAPASPGTTKLPLEHIKEDVTIEAHSAPVLAAEFIERPTLVPPEDCEADAHEPAAEIVQEQNLVPAEDFEPDAGEPGVEEQSLVPPEDSGPDADESTVEEHSLVPPEDFEPDAGEPGVEEQSLVPPEDFGPDGHKSTHESMEEQSLVHPEDFGPDTDKPTAETVEEQNLVPPEDFGPLAGESTVKEQGLVPAGDFGADVGEPGAETGEVQDVVPPEDCGPDANEPTAETVQEQNLPVIIKQQLKEELEISFPPAPEGETMPILISSSVADIVSGHPGLEVDIAGKPLKQELMDGDHRQMDDCDDDDNSEISKSHQEMLVSPKEDMFEKVTPKSSNFIDRKTGTLLLKKTKRGRPRKLFAEKEEKIEEKSKNFEAEEEHIIRRSSRSRKPVNKDYRSEANEIDELMSDDDDEYLMSEDDYDTDTDGDWRGGESDQPPKKRIKKVVLPPDPTAFDTSTKGRFRCWLCKKVFSKCAFAKSHMIQKHKEGLCAIYLDKSEECKSLCLLVFCPRKCRYVTLSLEGLMSHVESCAETELEADGKPYLEINKGFLENRFKELQAMSLEAVLSTPKVRKPKDPSKSPRVRKSLSLNKSAASTPVITHHSEASLTIKAENVIPSTAVSSSVPMVTSPDALQTGTSHQSGTADHGPAHPQPAVRPPTATDPCTVMASNKNSFPPQRPAHYNSSQPLGQQPTPVVVGLTSPRFHHNIGSPVSSPAQVGHKHPPGQQMFRASDQHLSGQQMFRASDQHSPGQQMLRASDQHPPGQQMLRASDQHPPGQQMFRASDQHPPGQQMFRASDHVTPGSSFSQPTPPRMSNIGFNTSDRSFPQSAVSRMSNVGGALEQIKTSGSSHQPALPRMTTASFGMSEQMKGSTIPQSSSPRMSSTDFRSSEQVKTSSSFPQSAPPRVSNLSFSAAEQVKGSLLNQTGPSRMPNANYGTAERGKASSFTRTGLSRMPNANYITAEQVKGSSLNQTGPSRMPNANYGTAERGKASGSYPQPGPSGVSNSGLITDQDDDIVYMIEDNGTICLK